ncbi:MAG: ABC transporter permease, partial [Gemmatimonadota bacterium]|nr:ABC transporter permease [Gemmatimonadota bacterium]
MIFRDQFRYAFGNLRKTRLRTTLTALGVAIGIGAMTSMVSVGAGAQRNVLTAFNEQFLLTSVMVRPSEPDSAADEPPALDQAAITAFEELPGVRAAYPVVAVPGLLVARGNRLFRNLEGMPAWLLEEQIERGRVELVAGRAYTEGEPNALVLSERAAGRLLSDSVPPDTLVGQTLSFIVAQGSDSPDDAARAMAGRMLGVPIGQFEPTT